MPRRPAPARYGASVCALAWVVLLPKLAVADGSTPADIPWTAQDRKANRDPDLWRYYQHGIVDHFATPFRFEDLLGDDQPAERWLDADQPIANPYRRSAQAAVRCVGSDSIELARPLPLPMAALRGRRVRIFFWMKGVDAGARNSTWHCPDAETVIRDGAGRVLAVNPCKIKCQRTFPWHCFSKVLFLSDEAAAVHVRLYNKHHGTAWFSTPAWEAVGGHNSYSKDERQDPYTGSLSENPLHEPLAHHFWHGFASRYPWRFVLGATIGMKGHTHDITTKEGLSRYYVEKARHDPGEMNHGVLHLRTMYYTGRKNGCLPPLEAGWLKHLGRIIIDDQDPETGYWHDGRALSLGLTFHMCTGYFKYHGIPRADRPDRLDPSRNLGDGRVPRADRIVRTTLMMQSSYVDAAGVRRKAGWNEAAYRYTAEPDAGPERCWLPSTWDAIVLMRLASRYVGDDLRREVDASVKAAFRYVLREMVFPDGLWRMKNTDDHVTGGGYMRQIMGDSAWLERRILPGLPQPRVAVEIRGRTVTVTWRDPAEGHNSLRIYAPAASVDPATIDASHLAGIIHRAGHRVYAMDPLVAVQVIRRSAVARWGGSMDLPPDTNWRGMKYLPWKLRRVPYPLARSDDLEPLAITLKDRGPRRILVSATSWYGEESQPVEAATVP